jgi:hypothetical protein
VFLAGIVGVPWQDIGCQDASGNLVYIPLRIRSFLPGVAEVNNSGWTGVSTREQGQIDRIGHLLITRGVEMQVIAAVILEPKLGGRHRVSHCGV